MPAVSVVYAVELKCVSCGEILGVAQARSIVKNKDGAIILFDDADPPKGLVLGIICPQGHKTLVPKNFNFELSALTPKNAAAGALVVATGGITMAGKPLKL